MCDPTVISKILCDPGLKYTNFQFLQNLPILYIKFKMAGRGEPPLPAIKLVAVVASTGPRPDAREGLIARICAIFNQNMNDQGVHQTSRPPPPLHAFLFTTTLMSPALALCGRPSLPPRPTAP